MEGPSQGGNRQSRKPIAKENLKQNRRDDRRDIGRKNEIFKHGIKDIKKLTGKYNTSKPLTEVKINCPCGLKWTWQDLPHSRGREGSKNTSMDPEMYCTFPYPLTQDDDSRRVGN